MFSCNAPVPGRVSRIADDLYPLLVGFERVRERHSLLVKRLGDADGGADHLVGRVRRALSGLPPVRVRTGGIGVFEDPPVGTGPVVYLAVESPGIVTAHERLVEEFGAVEGLEGEGYVPHVTLARGGDPAAVRRLRERDPDPVTWTVEELHVFDAAHEEVAARISLPA
ncbi:phosphoesterase [Halobacteriales archaeon QS_8_69_26]|nr:MAG: phosphoesterase [Halobacteriales archaeon QS_8_69_26]